MKPPAKSDRKITYKEHITPMRAMLAERFPKTFMPKGSRQKPPLAIGIDEAIIERIPDIDVEVLKWALFDYTQGYSYLDGIRIGAFRLDLDGNPVGNILPDDVTYAGNVIRNRKRREASRKKA